MIYCGWMTYSMAKKIQAWRSNNLIHLPQTRDMVMCWTVHTDTIQGVSDKSKVSLLQTQDHDVSVLLVC